MPDESSELVGGISVSIGATHAQLVSDLARADQLLEQFEKRSRVVQLRVQLVAPTQAQVATVASGGVCRHWHCRDHGGVGRAPGGSDRTCWVASCRRGSTAGFRTSSRWSDRRTPGHGGGSWRCGPDLVRSGRPAVRCPTGSFVQRRDWRVGASCRSSPSTASCPGRTLGRGWCSTGGPR